MKKFTAVILAGVLLALALSACGGGMSSSSSASFTAQTTPPAPAATPPVARDYAKEEYALEQEMGAVSNEAAYDMADTAGGSGAVAGAGSAQVSAVSRKIITTVNLQMETKEFDTGVDRITALVEEFGGFVQSSYVEGKSLYNERGTRNANYTLRVPSEKINDLTATFAQEFNITSTDQYGDDVTDHYYDTEARLSSLRIQEKQLLEMLENAGELKYLLEVQRELANVRYEIESLTSSLQRMDSYVSMSTMNVYLREVVEYEQIIDQPATFGEELRNTVWESAKLFGDFCRGIVLTLVLVFPYLLILAVLVFFFLRIRRKRKNRGKARWNAPGSLQATPAPEEEKTAATPGQERGKDEETGK